MPKGIFKDLTGKKFSRLTPLRRVPEKDGKRMTWLCLCDCGKETLAETNSLTHGYRVSCGCLMVEKARTTGIKNTKHGLSRSGKVLPEYAVWINMVARCTNPKHKQYNRYGGRGIMVCDRWLKSVSDFISDMGHRPSAEYSIDRIDNDGNYELSNCRWATRAMQLKNRSNNHWIEHDGLKMVSTDWDDLLGFKHGLVSRRILSNKWSIEDAVTKPLEYRGAALKYKK